VLLDGGEGLAAVAGAPGGQGSTVVTWMQLLTTTQSRGPADAPARLGDGVALPWI
jgi:hypothetical protein